MFNLLIPLLAALSNTLIILLSYPNRGMLESKINMSLISPFEVGWNFVWLIFSWCILKYQLLKANGSHVFKRLVKGWWSKVILGMQLIMGAWKLFVRSLNLMGIRELSRGFGLSGMTYSSSSAVRWASDGSSQRLIRKSFFELQFTWLFLLD